MTAKQTDTPDQCMQELRALTHRYAAACGEHCGETVHHAVCTCLMFIDHIATYSKTGVEFRMILGKTMLELGDEYFGARLPKPEGEEAEATEEVAP